MYTTYLLSAFFSFSSNSYYGPNAQYAYATTTAATTNDVAATAAAATTTATANATTGMVLYFDDNVLTAIFYKLVQWQPQQNSKTQLFWV